MSRRNIWITFEDWSQLRKELGIKRKKTEWGMRDEYWWFSLTDHQVKEWKKSIKKYGKYEEKWCFERTGLDWRMLKKVKTPGIYNRLLKSYYRAGDYGTMFTSNHREERDDWIINNFIAWAMNHVNGIDDDTTMEEWKRINSLMNKKMELTNKERWWYEELVELFNEVRIHVPVERVALCS